MNIDVKYVCNNRVEFDYLEKALDALFKNVEIYSDLSTDLKYAHLKKIQAEYKKDKAGNASIDIRLTPLEDNIREINIVPRGFFSEINMSPSGVELIVLQDDERIKHYIDFEKKKIDNK